MSLKDRQDQFSQLINHLKATMDQLDTLVPADVLRGAARRLAGFRIIRNGALSKGQRDIDLLKEDAVNALNKEADRIESEQRGTGILMFRPVNSHAAVWRQAQNLAPSWAAAIGIDLFPLVLLLLIVCATVQMRDPWERPPSAYDVPTVESQPRLTAVPAPESRT